MSCKCGSERIVNIDGKTSDMFSMSFDGETKDGYVPNNLFFGKDNYGDYMTVEFCADCGKIQAEFPISNACLKKAMSDMENED